MAEWLRRWTWNPMGSSRAGSNPARSETGFVQPEQCIRKMTRVEHPTISSLCLEGEVCTEENEDCLCSEAFAFHFQSDNATAYNTSSPNERSEWGEVEEFSRFIRWLSITSKPCTTLIASVPYGYFPYCKWACLCWHIFMFILKHAHFVSARARTGDLPRVRRTW